MPAAYRGRRTRRQARGRSQAEEEGDERRDGVHGQADVSFILAPIRQNACLNTHPENSIQKHLEIALL